MRDCNRIALKKNAACMIFALAMLWSAVATAQSAGGKTAPEPDISGVWIYKEINGPTGGFDPPLDKPPLQPWAAEKYREILRQPKMEIDPTIKQCFPPGMPRILLTPEPFEIIQQPGRVIMFFEYDHFVRWIYTDGRGHPKAEELDPTWMGHSIGRWDGDTFVVDTVGLNDKSWLDLSGIPHSEALHIVERIRRVDQNTLEDRFTFTDPKAFTQPWEARKIYKFRSGWEIMERVCADNFNWKPQVEEGK